MCQEAHRSSWTLDGVCVGQCDQPRSCCRMRWASVHRKHMLLLLSLSSLSISSHLTLPNEQAGGTAVRDATTQNLNAATRNLCLPNQILPAGLTQGNGSCDMCHTPVSHICESIYICAFTRVPVSHVCESIYALSHTSPWLQRCLPPTQSVCCLQSIDHPHQGLHLPSSHGPALA